jgi:hypothetical protein
MRIPVVILSFGLIGCLEAGAQEPRAGDPVGSGTMRPPATAAASSPAKDSGNEFTLGSQSVGNVGELIKKVGEQNDTAKKRIAEIDAYVNPILGGIANQLYGISDDEYQFLMSESRARRSAMVFRRQQQADSQTQAGILEYYNSAYTALQGRDFWFGNEQSLVPQDNALYQLMKTDIMAALAKRPDGEKIRGMLTERETLASRLSTNLPLYNYLSQRRKWWTNYPEYMKAVQQEAAGADSNTNTEFGPPDFPGGFGGNRGGGGSNGSRAR